VRPSGLLETSRQDRRLARLGPGVLAAAVVPGLHAGDGLPAADRHEFASGIFLMSTAMRAKRCRSECQGPALRRSTQGISGRRAAEILGIRELSVSRLIHQGTLRRRSAAPSTASSWLTSRGRPSSDTRLGTRYWLSTSESAEMLGLAPNRVRQLVERGCAGRSPRRALTLPSASGGGHRQRARVAQAQRPEEAHPRRRAQIKLPASVDDRAVWPGCAPSAERRAPRRSVAS
jgi:plasmid maintenance system antidote protein VapI